MNFLIAVSRTIFLTVVSLWAMGAGAQTGDGVIDTWLTQFVQKGGNNDPPTFLQIGYYSSWGACNSSGAPTWEAKCPSDLTYTPGTNGAYQAFGVGHTPVAGHEIWEQFCYWTSYYDPNLDMWISYPNCDWYYTGWQPAYSHGVLAAQIEFATAAVSTEAGSETLSTLAFTSAQSHFSTAKDCYPDHFLLQAPCNTSRQNAYIVPYSGGDGVGFEDKIVIQNLACPFTRVRDDGAGDRNIGCYAAADSSWWSDLPGAYKDTTAYSFGSYDYNPGVGTTEPENITPGYVYGWWRAYWAWGLDNALGVTRHVSGVTQYFNETPCNGGSGTLCQFQVDQTNIAPYSTVF